MMDDEVCGRATNVCEVVDQVDVDCHGVGECVGLVCSVQLVRVKDCVRV